MLFSFTIRETVIWNPQTDIELQEKKQTDENREYETSPSDGEDEDTMCSRKSNSLQDRMYIKHMMRLRECIRDCDMLCQLWLENYFVLNSYLQHLSRNPPGVKWPG